MGIQNSSQGWAARMAVAWATDQVKAAPARPQESPASPASSSHWARVRAEGRAASRRALILSFIGERSLLLIHRLYYTSAVNREKIPVFGRKGEKADNAAHLTKGKAKKFEKFFTIPLPFSGRLEYNNTAQTKFHHNFIRSDTNEHQSRY